MSKDEKAPEISQQAVLVKSEKDTELLVESMIVKGYEFNNGVDYDKLLSSFLYSGYQATNFGLAIQEINKMVNNPHPNNSDKLEIIRRENYRR
jgi:deoxyhypusine synthase